MKKQKTAGAYLDHRSSYILQDDIELTSGLDALLDIAEVYYLTKNHSGLNHPCPVDVRQSSGSIEEVYDFVPREQAETLWYGGTFQEAIRRGILIPVFGYDVSEKGGHGPRARFGLTDNRLLRKLHGLGFTDSNPLVHAKRVLLQFYFAPYGSAKD